LTENVEDRLRKMALRDGRFSAEAFRFLDEGLAHTVRVMGRTEEESDKRHVTGQELLEGMKTLARDRFGPMAAQVWRSWGVNAALDWGRIVFLLVDEGLLNRQDGDAMEDFDVPFDFDEYFVKGYQPKLPPELGARPPGEDG